MPTKRPRTPAQKTARDLRAAHRRRRSAEAAASASASASAPEAPRGPGRARFPPAGEEVTRATTRAIPVAEHAHQVHRVRDALVAFLQKPVSEVAEGLGADAPRGAPPDAAARRAVSQALIPSLTAEEIHEAIDRADPEALRPLDGLVELMRRSIGNFGKFTVANVLRADVAKGFASRKLHLLAIVLLRAGLGSFLRYGQCVTECHQALTYAPRGAPPADRSAPRADLRELADACEASQRALEDALGLADLRDFDRLLLEASGGRCSVALPPLRGHAPIASAAPDAAAP